MLLIWKKKVYSEETKAKYNFYFSLNSKLLDNKFVLEPELSQIRLISMYSIHFRLSIFFNLKGYSAI